jgi:hypothetical protein
MREGSTRRLRGGFLFLVAAAFTLATAAQAVASHSLDVHTDGKARLLSPAQVRVTGELTCVGAPEQGTVGVVLIQPPDRVTLNGGGSATFACSAGETVSWTVVVHANEFSTFAKGRARFDTFANTECSDEEVDCPSVGEDGILKIKTASVRV